MRLCIKWRSLLAADLDRMIVDIDHDGRGGGSDLTVDGGRRWRCLRQRRAKQADSSSSLRARWAMVEMVEDSIVVRRRRARRAEASR
ncbi:hypothetical protein ACLOJK_024267 [Asimina triloba]